MHLHRYTIVLFLLMIAASQTTFAEGNSDTLTIDIKWQPIKNIQAGENESFQTLNAESAFFLQDYNFLPVISEKIDHKQVEKIEVVSIESDTLGEIEKPFFDEKHRSSFPVVQFRNIFTQNIKEAEVFVYPFHFDSLTNQFTKIKSITLLVDFKNSQKNKNTYSNRKLGNSVLSSGKWHKLAVMENGVYKIDRQDLQNLGVDVDRLDPQKIKIYGNGGGVLPQANDSDRIEDLYENSIFVSGEDDGNFDNEDYVLFYGQSPHKISFDTENEEFDYQHNFYSDTTFYFLTVDGSDGKRIATNENLSGDFPKIRTYDDLLYYEENTSSIISSGREWVGEKFDTKVYQSFAFNNDDLVLESDITFKVSVVGQTYEETVMRVGINDDYFGEMSINAIPEGVYLTKGYPETSTFTYKLNEVNNLNVNLNFDQVSGVKSSAFLDYLNLRVKRHLRVQNDQVIWQSFESLNNTTSTFEIENVNGQQNIWDISDPLNPAAQNFNVSGTNAIFSVNTETLKKFITFNTNNLKDPILNGEIANQNLRGEGVPDLIIVSHPLFLDEANRLADHKRSFNNLDVLVTTPQKIYNEFSSGSQDVTAIRDMVKYFYDKGNQEKLKNLLILGRGSYDYKDRLRNNTNYVPIYQSRNSFHPVFSYGSDDYYTFLEEEEGEWGENISGDHTMDIGVGRLPVISREEAKIIVDKIIHYSSNPLTLGEWRNKIHFVADDGDANIFQRDAEQLSTYIDTTAQKFLAEKIYLDAFEQINEGNIESSPEANEALNRAVDNGGLIVNYIGHGSETRWCQETILDINMIREWENFEKLPLFVTATCEFGKHDDPKTISGADFLLFNENGGAIGLVTTSRPVYSNSNYNINLAFYQSLFEQNGDGYLDLGTIFRNTKNRSLQGSNNRNFILLGDPSLKLAFPKNDIRLIADSLGFNNPGDTISGLEKVKLTGSVLDINQNQLTNFNGTVTATLYDQPTTITTYGTESAPMDFDVRKSLIFKGDATIKNGKFVIEFVSPKDLSEIVDKGKLSLYAYHENSLEDAAGSDMSLRIGGPLENQINDLTPPDITLFINDTTFENGGITSPDILAVAKLFDENGINILNNNEIQGVLFSLDGEPFEYVGEYFKSEKDDYQSGWLRYPLFDLEEGEHYITVGAYDVNGNYAENSIDLIVTSGRELEIKKLLNYPNPFINETTFTFEHNRAGEDLFIELEIFNIRGKLIYRARQKITNSKVKVEDIKWYGQSNSGGTVEPGMYVYLLSIRSLKDHSNISARNKLLIIK